METEANYEQLMLAEESSPSDHQPMLKRLKKKKKKSMEDCNIPSHPSNGSELDSKTSESEDRLLESEELEKENESDGLDPLFSEGISSGPKRVIEFDNLPQGFDASEEELFGDDVDFEEDNGEKKKMQSSEELNDKKEKKKKKRKADKSDVEKKEKKKGAKSVGFDGKPKISKRKEKEERKAYLEQIADYQRVMRERKGVGFNPVPMVQKPISSVLEKIRQRKLEVSKKVMVARSLPRNDSLKEIMLDSDPEDDDYVMEILDSRTEKDVLGKPIAENSAMNANLNASHVKATSGNKPHSSNEQTSSHMPMERETTQLFRAPIGDTQDLFPEDDPSNEESASPVEEDVVPSLPSMNLKFDSALPDDISTDEEESDKENIDPLPKPFFKRNSSPKGDPVKEFVDEEALEDDSDNDPLNFKDEDEEDNADMEEMCDYIASDCNEKPIDREKRNELHQMWLKQQDEVGTENLLQRLKYGVKHKEPCLLKDEDGSIKEDDEDEYDDDDDDDDDEDGGDLYPTSGVRLSTKRLRQMIPLMFTDKEDGYVSSEDEEIERRLSKQRLLQKLELEQQSKFSSSAEDETSREVSGCIKKLNKAPETKKKTNTSSFFDTLLAKGGSDNASKSSFLRRASSQPATSSHRHGPSTGKSFIFGRDDSNSRTSLPLSEDSPDLSQKDSQTKRNASAKFISSQTKRSAQHTQITSEKVSGNSLFDILRRSSAQTCHDNGDDVVDHQAIFASFKSVKKLVKIEGRF